MKTSKQIPPIYFKIKKVFPVQWDSGVAIAYGDTVYCKFDLGPDVLAHEKVHLRQQENRVEGWWDLYLSDRDFRMLQEIEAYKAQIRWLRANVEDKPLLKECIQKVRLDFCSPMYGFHVTPAIASRILR